MRKALLWILSALLVATICLFGLAALQRWLAGEKFHTLLEQKTSEALNASASFGPLRWGGCDLFSPQFRAEGLGSGSLRHLEASSLRARLNPVSLLRGFWHVEEISLERASFRLGSSHVKRALKEEKAPAGAASSLPAWFPSLLVIDVIRAGQADILIELPSGKELDLLGTRLEAHPEGTETRFEVRGGILRNPFLPDLDVAVARCRMKKNSVELTGADLSFPAGGTLHLEGSFPDTQESTLAGRWEKVPLATLLPLLSQQLVGTVGGEATVQWDPSGFHSLEGNIAAKEVTLSGIPLLEEVSRLTRMEAFHHLFLQEARANFSVKGSTASWRDVILESQGLIKLTGEAEMRQDGGFSGTFQLGLSDPIVKVIPGASQVFSRDQHDGYFWTPLQVGGTLSHPTEDLTPRITAAVLRNAGLLIQQGVKQGLEMLGVSGGNPSVTKEATNPSSAAAASTSATGAATQAATNGIETLKQGGGAVLDVLGGFLK